MSMLLKHGVDPNLVNRDGWTPLHLAAKKGVNEAIEAMILHNLTSKNKFDFSQRGGKKGQTCLHIAAQNNNFELCFLLLSTIGALCRNSQD
jgi:ankyrin repeat protein